MSADEISPEMHRDGVSPEARAAESSSEINGNKIPRADSEESSVQVSTRGDVWFLRLNRPPGNIIDSRLCEALRERILAAAGDTEAKLLVVSAAGENFSFGASVEEHLPGKAEKMLADLHAVILALYSHPCPTLAAVQGRCLGGGLELAVACDFMFIEENAVLAVPEIRLGVFAPAATALLQASIPRALAAEILLTGREVTAQEAVDWGLANRMVGSGALDSAAHEFADCRFRPRSAASLRKAVQAFRSGSQPRHPSRLTEELTNLERLYMEELLPLHDGTEGIRAFLEKRQPQWENR